MVGLGHWDLSKRAAKKPSVPVRKGVSWSVWPSPASVANRVLAASVRPDVRAASVMDFGKERRVCGSERTMSPARSPDPAKSTWRRQAARQASPIWRREREWSAAAWPERITVSGVSRHAASGCRRHVPEPVQGASTKTRSACPSKSSIPSPCPPDAKRTSRSQRRRGSAAPAWRPGVSGVDVAGDQPPSPGHV